MNKQQTHMVDEAIAKLMAETMKINTEHRYYPFIVAAGLMGAGAALAKMFM
ncbi:hypothetical protein [Thalassovita aquimarina]|uniref:Uncharacterized protein n=1 Tax=Thalassovita aquimarina TaxID=2785917 RepID=A0ABS5HMQ7_9RHOB|nr:hypothetical protein [Thalassovita aquimarina]MBR9650240.1 hypothetical protein [Thalassovita aquimarina]